jgi:hypothetical protein
VPIDRDRDRDRDDARRDERAEEQHEHHARDRAPDEQVLRDEPDRRVDVDRLVVDLPHPQVRAASSLGRDVGQDVGPHLVEAVRSSSMIVHDVRPLWRITFIAIDGCPNERTNPRRFSCPSSTVATSFT